MDAQCSKFLVGSEVRKSRVDRRAIRQSLGRRLSTPANQAGASRTTQIEDSAAVGQSHGKLI